MGINSEKIQTSHKPKVKLSNLISNRFAVVTKIVVMYINERIVVTY